MEPDLTPQERSPLPILRTIFGPFNTVAPPGMCPWAEQQCDDQCSDFSGCKNYREKGPVGGDVS